MTRLPARLRLVLVGLAVCAVAGVAGALLATDPDDGPERAGGGLQGFQRPDIPPSDFALRNQDGETVRLSSLRGTPVVVTFMYSTCEDTCPILADQIRGALDDVGDGVPALAVSVDPENDTEVTARRFLLDRKLTGRMDFLLGDERQLRPIWKEYGIQPQGEGFEHSAYVLLVDAEGRQRVSFPVSALTPEALADDLRLLRAEASPTR